MAAVDGRNKPKVDPADARYAAIPELHGLCDDVRWPVFSRAYRRSFRSPRVWLAYALMFLLVVLGQSIARRWAGRHSWLVYVGIGIGAVLGAAIVGRIRLSLLRRTVRAELGMNCPGCDYDLRGGHERCPECGRVVERKGGQRQGSQGVMGAREPDATADQRG